MKHARLRQKLVQALIFVSAATAIITVPACNSPRKLETSGGPMVESARSRDLRSRSLDETPVSSRTVKKEEPKKDEVTLPVKMEKVQIPKDVTEAKEGETVTVIDKDGKEKKVKRAIRSEPPELERRKPTTFK